MIKPNETIKSITTVKPWQSCIIHFSLRDKKTIIYK